jgi:hypothetical protein
MLRAAAAAVLAASAVLVGISGPAHAETTEPPGVTFGPELDWNADGPEGYRMRLGETPATYAIRLPYPVDERAKDAWQRAATSAAEQGAALILTMEPVTDFEAMTGADVEDFAAELGSIHDQYGTRQLVRFAPEMNGSWTTWGQQPAEFVTAFRSLADRVHDGSSGAEMVWAPSYGSGYPFERADGNLDDVTARDLVLLDTDRDGVLTETDDPYGPYYPGDDAVDRVGLTMFYFSKGAAQAAAGRDVPLESNSAPQEGELAARLDERWGYTTSQPASFYERFAVGKDRDLLLDTGALYDPALEGDSNLAVKQGWWRQLLAELPAHPRITAVTWIEAERAEDEAGTAEVDWRATVPETLADELRTDLRESGIIRWGPLTAQITDEEGSAATVQVRQGGDEFDWVTGGAAVLAVLFLLSGLIRRFVPAWRYAPSGGGRDPRLDMLRGIALVAMLATYIELTSPYSLASVTVLGAISGAELFVLLSGIALGMTYARRRRPPEAWPAAMATWKRARTLYLVALVVTLIVFAIGFIPFVDTSTVTTFTDRGVGPAGTSGAGRIYDLYPDAERLLDYPPPWYVIQQLLLLEIGPWPLNMIGLFVALLLVAPGFFWLLQRGMWWVVLIVSWGLYILHFAAPGFRLLPSQFDAAFPLLVWQLVFVHGLVIGFHRELIVRALRSTAGRIVAGIFVVAYAVVLTWVWTAERLGDTAGFLPADTMAAVTEGVSDRIDLQGIRLLNLLLVLIVAYAVLTAAWTPLRKLLGWLFIPLGQAPLYVLIVTTFLVLAVANIPGLDRAALWQGALIHTLVIAIVYLMVRKRFLFSVIPR